MANQNCIAISELHPNFSHPKIVGIIIGKSDVKSFPDRRNAGAERFTFSFTVKDSPDFFINVTAWGNEGFISGLSNSVGIGDCVTIENPLVSGKDPEKGDKFCPSTPSLYRLTVNESHCQVHLCEDMDTVDRLLPLIHLPVKDPRDFYSLGDIEANGQSLDGTLINILAAVKSVGELRQFTTSDGRQGQRLELKLFDDLVPSFPLVCWDREPIQLVHNQISKGTVLFIADAKISFDGFRNGMIATVNSKTIITVNPDTREASLLFRYAKEAADSGALDQDDTPADVTVESITDVYTVHQLKQRAKDTSEVFFGITYGFITRLDLDSSVSKIIKTRCARCKALVNDDVQSCFNQLCPGRGQVFSYTAGFDLLVDVTDHTGTLTACTLQSPEAEKTFGCSKEEFTSMTDDGRTEMKWTYLLERCKIYMKVVPTTKLKSGVRGVILDCSLADPGEVKLHMTALLQQD
ncbi:meiosis-specific with OB domain-containing protein [Neosynchiropus ocellatus]